MGRSVVAAFAALALAASAAGCLSIDRDPTELPLGAAAPAFSLPDAGGKTVSLADLRAKGAPVLVFYRGHW